MSGRKNFRKRRESSSSSSEAEEKEEKQTDEKVDVKEKIEELKFVQKQRARTHGIDVYSLAIGEQSHASQANLLVENDPWKIKTGGLVDMRKIKERRGNEIVQNMTSNFAKETNQRDEDAEMQKFIEEQLRLRKEADLSSQQQQQQQSNEAIIDASDLIIQADIESEVKKFKRPEDALFDVPKYLIENKSKHKSEESLSEQMLSGIPEVDLGVHERIRNIEETERAKQVVGHGRHAKRHDQHSQYAAHNQSVNFVQHKRFDDALINPDHMIKPRMNNRPGTGKNEQQLQQQQQAAQLVVGDAPKHELLQQQAQQAQMSSLTAQKRFMPGRKKKPSNEVSQESKSHKRAHTNNNGQTAAEKATDDYCLERFKKNMRFSRNSKIKIC